ncbi:hypothetical protein ACA910_001560 [Epithemia clementina (nom. ined.)]
MSSPLVRSILCRLFFFLISLTLTQTLPWRSRPVEAGVFVAAAALKKQEAPIHKDGGNGWEEDFSRRRTTNHHRVPSNHGDFVSRGGGGRCRRFVDWINRPRQAQQDDNNNDFHEDNYQDVQILFMKQRLDHFRLSDPRTFAQRYFYSNRYVVDPKQLRQQQQQQQQQQEQPPPPNEIRRNAYNHEHNRYDASIPRGGVMVEQVQQDTRHSNLLLRRRRDASAIPTNATTTTTTTRDDVTTTNNNNTISKATQKTYAFLCVGGEGPSLDESVLVDSVHCTGDMIELAHHLSSSSSSSEKQHINIHLFALEHRYYGQSYPNFDDENDNSSSPSSSSPISTPNLVYLSSRQALADIGHFIAYHQNQHHLLLPPNTIWVTFGGSYPGMLAAWARWQFPHLIAAAVSSSAPVQAQLDFANYNNHIGQVLQQIKLPKNDHDHSAATTSSTASCGDIVQDGHEQLSAMFGGSPGAFLEQAQEHQQLRSDWIQIAKDFHLCNATTIFSTCDDGDDDDDDAWKNIAVFLGDGVISLDVQNNDPACRRQSEDDDKLCNLEQKCHFLINRPVDELPWQRLQQLAQVQFENAKQQTNDTKYCIDVSWHNLLEQVSKVDNNNNVMDDGERSWLWQTCTEFGFYQTCHAGSHCPFAQGWHSVQQDLEVCRVAFGGLTPRVVSQAIQETLEYYGGWNLSATRILSINGQVDPWSELAIRPKRHGGNHSATQDAMPAVMVPGASHHFWTHASKTTDSKAVVAARRIIHKTVIRWLRDAEAEQETNVIQRM